MATDILMPALSPTMTEGKLAKWVKKEGDTISSGQVIAEIETDKATMEIEAVDEGVLGRILVPEGTEGVAVNTPIAILVEAGEAVPDAPSASAPAVTPAATPAATSAGEEPKAGSGPVPVAPTGSPAPEPEKDWGETSEITVREALRDAMAAEMRRDGDVFLLGEEVASIRALTRCRRGCSTNSAPNACWTCRSPSMASPAWRPAPR